MSKLWIAIPIVALALLASLIYSQRRQGPLKVSGFIESDEIRLGSRVGGRVQAVLVQEGDRVRIGDTLVELAPYQLLEQKTQAEALLAEATAEHDRLVAGFRQEETAQAKARLDLWTATVAMLENGAREEDLAAAQAQTELAQAQLELAELKHKRAETLRAKNANTIDDLDQATTELKVAQATLMVRREELAKLQVGARSEEKDEARAQLEEARQAWLLKKNGYRPQEIAAADAAVDAAEAGLRAIERQIDELKIKAPFDGIVESIDLRPGDLIGPNVPAVVLADESRLWARAYVPENRLNLATGARLNVSVDSFPEERFHGTVTFVARQAEFTPGNVQTPEERSKQVFRIKVRIDEGQDRLRPGMSADVWLDPVEDDS